MLRGVERKEKSPSGSRDQEGRHGRSGACPLPAAPVGMVVMAPVGMPVSIVASIVTNGVSLLQTKLSHREGHKARRVGLEAMPLDQQIKSGHGEREPGVEIRPGPVHDLFEM